MMLIIFEISLFGESYTLSRDGGADARAYPTLDTDLTLDTELLPPVSLLLSAAFLFKKRGLPLEEFTVSDGKSKATVMRVGEELFLPISRAPIAPVPLEVNDSGVDIRPLSLFEYGKHFLILRCDDLSLLDKRLAPRLITRTAHDALIAYEVRDGRVEFFALSHSVKRGLLPTAALILYSLLGIKNISSGAFCPELCFLDGSLCLSAKPL